MHEEKLSPLEKASLPADVRSNLKNREDEQCINVTIKPFKKKIKKNNSDSKLQDLNTQKRINCISFWPSLLSYSQFHWQGT